MELHLSEKFGSCRRFAIDEMRRVYPKVHAVAAWRINLDDSHEVDILIDEDYPYSRARIGVAPLRCDVTKARVYVDDTLCLLTGDESHSLNDDESVVDELLRRAQQWIAGEEHSAAQRNSQEVVDYWSRSETNKRIVSICNVDASPREVFYSIEAPFALIGDSPSAVERWVKQYSGKTTVHIQKTAFLVSDTGFPTGMKTAHLLYEWFRSMHADQIALLQSVASGDPSSAPLLIGISGAESGMALLGCWISRPKPRRVGKSVPRLTPGFRKGKAPGHLAAPNFFTNDAKVEKIAIERADTPWLTERGGQGSSRSIRSARVAVIGCGSLGGTVARLLVKAGIQNLTLIDPQLLSWDNIARHELGGHYVGRSKAKSLKEWIIGDFPHVGVNAIHDTWQNAFRQDNDILLRNDLIISTTGDLAGDVQLSDAATAALNFPMLALAWFEPHCAAAHMLVLLDSGCLRCGCDEFGVFQHPATEWENATHRYEPGCSASWQPYSEVEALPAKAFIVQTALRVVEAPPDDSRLYSWVGAERVRCSHAGSLTQSWRERYGEPSKDGTQYELEWRRSCKACSNAA